MASNVEIVVKTVDESTKETKKISSGFKSMKKDLDKFNLSTKTTDQRLNSMRQSMTTTAALSKQKFDEMAKNAEKPKASFKDMAKGIAIAFAAVTAAALAMKKAIDLGAEGAKFDLLGQSAKNLGVDVEALQDSVGGTISEFAAMNAVNTLVAGTSGNLQEALVGNADKLLEIAKAANAVNPALGSTNFLYESLGKGIKRASPMILDNLGIIVKLEKAQSAMALSLGKTVSELTNEEKQMAILNETVKAGNVLIGQAAGLNTTAADAYAKFGAQGEDAANRLKAAWGVAIAPAVAKMADFLEHANDLSAAMDTLKTALDEGKISNEEYNEVMGKAVVGGKDFELEVIALAGSLDDLDVEIENSIGLHSEFARHTRLSAGATQEAAEANEDLAIALDDVNAGLGGTLDKYLETIRFMKAGGVEIQKQTNKVWADFEAGLITAGEAELLVTGLTIDLAFAMDEFGDMTFEEIVRELEDMGLPLNHAVSKAQELQREMELIDGAQADLFINIHQAGSIPGGFGGSGNVPGTNIPLLTSPSTVTDIPQIDGGEIGKSAGGFDRPVSVASGGFEMAEFRGEMMDLFSTFAEMIAESVSTNQGAL